VPTVRLVTKVWIELGCIACDACETICPDVFDVQEDMCLIRPAALEAAFNKPRTELIMDAAKECPVDVIRFETVEVDTTQIPAPAPIRPAADSISQASRSQVTRRTVVSAPAIGWLALTGSSVVGVCTLQRFMMPNVLDEPNPRVPIDDLAKYVAMTPGSVNQDHGSDGIMVVRLEDKIAALSTTCTHLGCLVNWLENERKFKCPCHGSGFRQDGINVEGPAPRPLERYKIAVEQGRVIVDRSKTFQQEKGQWNDPNSYVSVSCAIQGRRDVDPT